MIPQGQSVANLVLWQVKAGSCTLQTLHQEVDDPCSLVTADDPCSLVTTDDPCSLVTTDDPCSLVTADDPCLL